MGFPLPPPVIDLTGIEGQLDEILAALNDQLGPAIATQAAALDGISSALNLQIGPALIGLGQALQRIDDTIIGQLSGAIGRAVDDISDVVDTTGQVVNATIRDSVADVRGQIDGVETSVHRSISSSTATLAAGIGGVAATITAQIAEGVGTLTGVITATMGSVADAIVWQTTTYLDQIATIDDFLNQVGARIEANAGDYANLFAAALSAGLSGGGQNLLEKIEAEAPGSLRGMLSDLAGHECMPAPVAEWMRSIANPTAPLMALVLPLVGALLIFPAAQAAMQPFLERLTQCVSPSAEQFVIPPGAVADLTNRGLMEPGAAQAEAGRLGVAAWQLSQLRNLAAARTSAAELLVLLWHQDISREMYDDRMRLLGYSASESNLIGLTGRRLLTDDEVRAGLLRGEISEGEHDSQLGQTGLTTDLIALRKRLYFFIPPPQDLIRMAVREVFSPDQRAALSLDADFPDAFAQFAAQQGISREWAGNYWAAHWELPSPMQVFEMLHRGIVDGEQVTQYLRAADFAPIWRDRLAAISFNVFTRVDIRRMNKVGVLNREQVKRAYMDIGYPEERAEQLTVFTERLNAEEEEAAIEPFRLGLRTRALALYRDFVLSAHQLTDILSALGYSDAQITAYLAEGEFTREGDLAQSQRAGIKRLFIAGHIDTARAIERLRDAGHGTEEAGRLVASWRGDLEFRELTEQERENRDLTKAEILQAFRDGVITDVDAENMLLGLGYDGSEVAVLLALTLSQSVRAEQTAIRDNLRLRYLRGSLTLEQVRTELDKLNYRATYRDALIERWTLEKRVPKEVVPQPTIRVLLQAKLITQQRALELLGEHQLPDDVRIGLMDLWRRGVREE